jgi:hypothetical protein
MNSVMLQAVKRQNDRPDIHKPIIKLRKGYAFDQETLKSISEMVSDLKEHCPLLTRSKLSRLIGVSVTTICDLPNFDDDDDYTGNNEASAAAELAALAAHHDQYKDDVAEVLFDGRKPDADEWCYVPVFLAPRPVEDTYRRADQSHSNKRPITLATTPYSVAA